MDETETEEIMLEEQESQPEDSIQNWMFHMHFTKEQLNEVQRAMLVHVPKQAAGHRGWLRITWRIC